MRQAEEERKFEVMQGSAFMVCEDCFFAHHYGITEVEREATDDERHAWLSGYLRGHDLPNVVEESDHGLTIREWFAGESDSPSDREPLCKIPRHYRVSDGTCSGHDYDQDECPLCGSDDDGLQGFAMSSCDGCGSTLGGARYRLWVHPA